jgi:hypothetical protein
VSALAGTRCCPGCKQTKPVAEFTETDLYCKTCRREINVIQNGNRRRGYKLEDAYEPRF